MSEPWTAPDGVTPVMLHSRAAGPVDVALVMLAAGAVVPAETHAFAERIRMLMGSVSVTTPHGQVELTVMDSVLVIEAGLEHEIAARGGEASYLSIMSGHVSGFALAGVAHAADIKAALEAEEERA